MSIYKISRIAGVALGTLLGLLGLIAFIGILAGGDPKTTGNSGLINFGITVAIGGFIAIIALMVVFIGKAIVQNPKSMIKAGIGIVVLAVIFLIGRAMASDKLVLDPQTMSPESIATMKAIPSWAVKFSDAGIITLFAMIIITAVTIIGTEIWRLFK